MEPNIELLRRAVMDSREGITIADLRRPDAPLVYINPAFERLTGYGAEEVIGRNCRFLQGDDRDEAALAHIRRTIAAREPCLVTIRNYRKDGSMFWNELSLSPVFDRSGEATHYIGIQRDVTAEVLLRDLVHEQNQRLERRSRELARMVSIDPLTGVHNRSYLDRQLGTMLGSARRTGERLTLFMIDVDHFKAYNDLYGHPQGDNALCAIAGALERTFARSGDFVARYGGEEFAVVGACAVEGDAVPQADRLRESVRALEIPHEGSPLGRASISVGYAFGRPGESPEDLVRRADAALYEAKRAGRDCARRAA